MMVPIYAVDAFVSLCFTEESWVIFITIGRECYEAYVIFSFLRLLVNYGGGNQKLEDWMRLQSPVPWTLPFCCCSYQPSRSFLRTCFRGILQYVVLRPLMAICAATFFALGKYEEGHLAVDEGYLYVATVNNCSQMVALYYIVAFYECTRDLLAPHRPVLKFIVIKAVVFFSFWQAVAIAIMTKIGWIKGNEDWPAHKISQFTQDALICFEMFLAALSHTWAFSYKPYVVSSAGDGGFLNDFGNPKHMGMGLRRFFGISMAISTSAAKNAVQQTDVVQDTVQNFSRDDQADTIYAKLDEDDEQKGKKRGKSGKAAVGDLPTEPSVVLEQPADLSEGEPPVASLSEGANGDIEIEMAPVAESTSHAEALPPGDTQEGIEGLHNGEVPRGPVSDDAGSGTKNAKPKTVKKGKKKDMMKVSLTTDVDASLSDSDGSDK